MAWKLAPALAALISDVNQAWPDRSKASDGTIGDASHSARKSEHNPNREPDDDVPDGYVTAADIDKDGIDPARLLRVLIADQRVWYVIWDRHIYSRTYGFKKRPYNGSNPHTGHLHVSLVQTRAACDDTSNWGLSPARPKPKPSYAKLWSIAHKRQKLIQALRRKLRR